MLGQIATVEQALTEHTLALSGDSFSPIVMGREAESGEIVVRQSLLSRIVGPKLNSALLYALGKKQGRVVFRLPREWREVLARHGFKVAHLRSAILWHSYVCAHLLWGIAKIGKIALAGISIRRRADSGLGRYAHFENLGPSNLPQVSGAGQSHDVVSWYLQWIGKTDDIEAVCHTVAGTLPCVVGEVKVTPTLGPLPDLVGSGAVGRFLVWGLRASFIAAIDFMCGRWWHAFLLSQAALAAQARFLPAKYLAREYLFHNSGWISRPLWTYEAERRGAKITFYFYSSNCEGFKRAEGYPPPTYGWKAMTWPRYLVWDEYQEDFVRRAVGESARISVVGAIWFSTEVSELRTLPKNAVAVFDVQPFRDAFYCTLGIDFDYYTPITSKAFLSDIYNVLVRRNATLVLKRKREIGRLAHCQYRKCLETFDELPNFVSVESSTSASRLIQDCIAVISMPFTSTALLGRELGKPSIYYDPHGVLQRDDRAAHGIEIIMGIHELNEWLNGVTSLGD